MKLRAVVLLGMASAIAAFSLGVTPGPTSTRSTQHLHPSACNSLRNAPHPLHSAVLRMSVASESAAASENADWRDGTFWEWRGMAVRYAVLNPAGEASPLLLVHGESILPPGVRMPRLLTAAERANLNLTPRGASRSGFGASLEHWRDNAPALVS
jgi:hypothetical protein